MININLVPASIKDKIKEARKTADTFSFALVILIIFTVASVLVKAADQMVLRPSLDEVKAQITKSNAELTKYTDLADQAKKINDRVNIAAKIEERKAQWSQITQDLINSVPQTIQFVSLTADATKSPNFVLQGETTTEQEVVLFKDKLDKSTFFKNVAFKSSTTTNPSTTDKASTDKTITFSLEFDLSKLFYTPNTPSTSLGASKGAQ